MGEGTGLVLLEWQVRMETRRDGGLNCCWSVRVTSMYVRVCTVHICMSVLKWMIATDDRQLRSIEIRDFTFPSLSRKVFWLGKTI